MVYRCFAEKKRGFDVQASSLLDTLRSEQGISGLESVRVLCRYDVEGISAEEYELVKNGVFSEPACDLVYDEKVDFEGQSLCVESLPGQFDQRADSCAQCIAMMTQKERPRVGYATLYIFGGTLTDEDKNKIKSYLINPVECREASLDKPQTLETVYPEPDDVKVLAGWTDPDFDLDGGIKEYGLAMDRADLEFLLDYFRSEKRDPTLTELRIIDTYWSDHCRHTTFNTRLESPAIEDENVKRGWEKYLEVRRELYGQDTKRPVSLMDMGTCGGKVLSRRGLLPEMDVSEEINACSIKISVDVDGRDEPWLLMFKNETHNHPTEIEPFGGAATCLGGAIRDPLSGRAWVYQAMRVTGAADPRLPLDQTMRGKLPQRVICRKAAQGYSSYGNQIGLATGLVSEVYHDDYVAKRLETGAVLGAAPRCNVVRERPAPGDVIVLLGGATGRDGIGGATGSSKSHSLESLNTCGAEVQKGNAPEERKLQRLFRIPEAARMIKRCNDFGAGGVSVAVGELADGLFINLDKVTKKYDGLDGTELAISESQERMAVVLDKNDVERFMQLADSENLEATVIAEVTEEPRMKMVWRGKLICDISREFLDSTGAPKTAFARVPAYPAPRTDLYDEEKSAKENAENVLTSLNVCINKGLSDRFDSSIGAAGVMMPFGGRNQLTPAQAMVCKMPLVEGNTTTASVMAWGFDPHYTDENPYVGARDNVYSSAARAVCAGADPAKLYFSFQEFFGKTASPEAWGKPMAAVLGALDAQLTLSRAAIGGKDSMSGTFNDIDVPATLISFAVGTVKTGDVITPEFKGAGHEVCLFAPDGDVKRSLAAFHELCKNKKVLSAWAVAAGGGIEAVCKMAVGNDIGFTASCDTRELFKKNYGAIIAEMAEPGLGRLLGVTGGQRIRLADCEISIDEAKRLLTSPLEEIYPTKVRASGEAPVISYKGGCVVKNTARTAKPLAVIPVFPGTNCEFDTRRAIERAGGEGKIVLIRNRTADHLKQSVRELESELKKARMLIIPGGFSGGDEPEGSGKFIQALLRAPQISDAVMDLLYNRDGLALGICNGFQALIKLGLVPFGKIREMDASCPTLTFNTIGRHQACYGYTRVASKKSPWLSKCEPGGVYRLPFSHGEGRFVADEKTLRELEANGQIAFQYCDARGVPSMDVDVNLNGSLWAIEGITSPDGRVLGKMGHSERWSAGVASNLPGEKFQPLFEGGVAYFTE